jgi:4-amino-4-deoxy-L-arabinose transferase-like glycosyltransferase
MFRADRRKTWMLAAAVACVLAVFALRLVHSARQKSPTFDEPFHVAGGLTYWRHNDYRLHPENGVLAQRIIALPLLVQDVPLPALDDPLWLVSNGGRIGEAILSADRESSDRILLWARLSVMGVAVLLGGVLFVVTRRAFGTGAALVTLTLYTLCPNVLAHARLATSDLIAALFFFLAVVCLTRLTRRITVGWAAALGLAAAAAALSKVSGAVLLPVALLVALRLLFEPTGRPGQDGVDVEFGSTPSRLRRLLLALVVSVGVAYVSIWACYGFRYGAMHYPEPESSRFLASWEYVLEPASLTQRVIDGARSTQLLPEGLLYGHAFARRFRGSRAGYLNGEVRVGGWWYFFPLAFLMKTPLGTLMLLGLSLALAASRGGLFSRVTSRRLFPSLAFCLVYGGMALASSLNIGVRHLLPLYPFLFVGLGWGAKELLARGRIGKSVLGALLVLTVAESAAIHPHYLAYFNATVGGPKHGYRHLIDSSLDWGQDLQALAVWLERNPSDGRTYLSYFGSMSPRFYGVTAERLPGFFDLWTPPLVHPLAPGRYLISASMLAPVYLKYCPGAWNADYEAAYRTLDQAWGARLDAGPIDPGQVSPAARPALMAFEDFRFGRLTAYLRRREPDHMVGHTILVYELSGSDLEAALHGGGAQQVPR